MRALHFRLPLKSIIMFYRNIFIGNFVITFTDNLSKFVQCIISFLSILFYHNIFEKKFSDYLSGALNFRLAFKQLRCFYCYIFIRNFVITFTDNSSKFVQCIISFLLIQFYRNIFVNNFSEWPPQELMICCITFG